MEFKIDIHIIDVIEYILHYSRDNALFLGITKYTLQSLFILHQFYIKQETDEINV